MADTHFSGERSAIAADIFHDPDNTTRAVVCDSEGRLIVDTAGTVIVDGTVRIEDSNGLALLSNGSGSLNVDVTNIVPVSQSGIWTVNLATEPTIDIGEVSIKPASTTVNIFATADASYGAETTILSYTNVGIKWITQVIGWGQYDGEFLVRINGTIVGGGRNSTANRTLQLQEPFATVNGDVITVTILEYGPGLQNFRANLIGQ